MINEGSKQLTGADAVRNADGDKLLVWVDLVIVHPPERFSDGDVLQQQDDCRHGKLRSERAEERGVDMERADVLEADGDGLKDLDGVGLLGGVVAMAGKEPGGDSENDDDEGVAKNREEEKCTSCEIGRQSGGEVKGDDGETRLTTTRITLCKPIEGEANGV